MKLRFRKHLTGAEGSIKIPWNVDDQHLFFSKIGKLLLMWDGTVMSWDGCQEVMQQEMQGEQESWKAEQKQC